MLDKTQRAAPLCIKCKQPTTFHSTQVVQGKSGETVVTVFRCESCDLLTARSIGKVAA